MANFPDEEKNGRDPDHWPDRAASATHKEAAAITALLSSEARGLALLRAVLDIGRNGLSSHNHISYAEELLPDKHMCRNNEQALINMCNGGLNVRDLPKRPHYDHGSDFCSQVHGQDEEPPSNQSSGSSIHGYGSDRMSTVSSMPQESSGHVSEKRSSYKSSRSSNVRISVGSHRSLSRPFPTRSPFTSSARSRALSVASNDSSSLLLFGPGALPIENPQVRHQSTDSFLSGPSSSSSSFVNGTPIASASEGDAPSRRRRLARVLDHLEGSKFLSMAHEALRQTPTEEDLIRPSSAHDEDQGVKTAEKKAKDALKRRRTINELCATEAAYATDMLVVRDIYLERVKGADLNTIADRVMSSGLGLHKLTGPASPKASNTGPVVLNKASIGAASPSSPGTRSVTNLGIGETFTEKLERRRAKLTASEDAARPGSPLLSSRDIHVVFSNIAEVAGLAEVFAGLLDGAKGLDEENDTSDRIGEVFREMIPRLQTVFSTYCSRHERATERLQELEADADFKTYLDNCKALSAGRTNAWDIHSLLIKPVQRALKYPLLLDQILSLTPEDHPDRDALQRANSDALSMAEAINEYKRRNDSVTRAVSKREAFHRRESSRSISSTVSKKLHRGSSKAKTAVGLGDAEERDDVFETLVNLVDSTKLACKRFASEMKEWLRTARLALNSQTALVDGWIKLYAPLPGESETPSYRRLVAFRRDVLSPLLTGPYTELNHEIRNSLVVKCEHLLSLFDNPTRVISKRNEKRHDHARYLKKRDPADRRASEDYQLLSAQLLEELPRFLASVSRYFNIIVRHFGGVQAAYGEAVQERWDAFADEWLVQIPAGNFEDIQKSFAQQHKQVDEIMTSLARGLGVASARLKSTEGRDLAGALQNSTFRLSAIPLPETAASPPRPADHARPRSADKAPVTFEEYSMRRSASASASSHAFQKGNRSSERISVDSKGSFGSRSSGTTASSSFTDYRRSCSSEISNSTQASTVCSSASREYRECLRPSAVPPLPVRPNPKPLQPRHDTSYPAPSGPPGQLTRRGSADSFVSRPSLAAQLTRGGAAGSKHYAEFWTHQQTKAQPPIPSPTTLDAGILPGSSSVPSQSAPAPNPVPKPRLLRAQTSDNDLRRGSVASRLISFYGAYSPSAEHENGVEGGQIPLYRAEALIGSRSSAFRAGYPLLSVDQGQQVDVLVEEADQAEGGAGWLLVRLVDREREIGWVRTEDFCVV